MKITAAGVSCESCGRPMPIGHVCGGKIAAPENIGYPEDTVPTDLEILCAWHDCGPASIGRLQPDDHDDCNRVRALFQAALSEPEALEEPFK